MTILVTGGCGFIGTNFIRSWLAQTNERVVNVDKLTYAGNLSNLQEFREHGAYFFHEGDICDEAFITRVIKAHRPRAIIHMAAESHVDRSISDATPFVKTNIIGTLNLLECVRKSVEWDFKFLHVSTDEVYGSLNAADAPFTEKTPYYPRSPYSASKASSDHFVNAYHHTYGIPTIVTNCSNNYGAYQYPEKFIPVVIKNAMEDKPIPVYGTGMNVRDWIYVEDHVSALLSVLKHGKIGEKYNIGGECQIDNLSLAGKILDIMGKPKSLLQFVEDRKGHDFRYDIDNSKIRTELGWEPSTKLDLGLRMTVQWYKENTEWMSEVSNENVGYNFSRR